MQDQNLDATKTEIEKVWDEYATAGYKNLYKMDVFKKITDYYEQLFIPINGVVLDGGCGPGSLFNFIIKGMKPKKIVAADLSDKMLNQAKKTAEEINKNNKNNIIFEFRKFNLLEKFPWADNTFDSSIFGISICYLPKDGWKKAVKEAFRTVKSGGYIYISTFIDKWDFPREVKKHTISEFFKSPWGCLWGLKLKKYPMLVSELIKDGESGVYPPIEEFIQFQKEQGAIDIVQKRIFFGAGVLTRAKKA